MPNAEEILDAIIEKALEVIADTPSARVGTVRMAAEIVCHYCYVVYGFNLAVTEAEHLFITLPSVTYIRNALSEYSAEVTYVIPKPLTH